MQPQYYRVWQVGPCHQFDEVAWPLKCEPSQFTSLKKTERGR